MKVSDFEYHLPSRLIAHYPAESRSGSKLLHLDLSAGALQHYVFKQLVDLLNPGDLLIFNDTKVIPARLFGRKESGGRFEALIERVADGNQLITQIKLSKAAKPGTLLIFESKDGNDADPVTAEVVGREGDFYRIKFPADANLGEIFARIGHIPLPPYIKRKDKEIDTERYQTVYARHDGAVAAPTAGLHFDQALLEALAQKGVEQAFITLHVGSGTFQPIRVDTVTDHKMHSEWIDVNQTVVDKITQCKERGGRVIAVGTTSVRSLETCTLDRPFSAYQGETDIFIYPGFDFKVVDAMVTNFHLPGSSLVMLVSAFASREATLGAYAEAVAQEYRFFSYGDAMLITR
jgi:S-adenosylmethionine:tRNA ribosyltransferase-isomerase